KNLIELKRADEPLFIKTAPFRNNTFSLTKTFSNAIQQVNVQRHNYVASVNDPLAPMCKSILIIGNKKHEFSGHQFEKELYYNLHVVRFNNKDIMIMTYDEIIERIDALVSVK
ncbi:MAG: DUF4263 domain-containing protein, partial [Erysipelotrichaceae bacterium]|nr:DUF4263 domain-containing protein [Erysipelotrichaceae bacterium]